MVFPVGDDNSDRTVFPFVTVGLIVINCFVFLVFQQAGTNQSFLMAFSTVPEEIYTGRDLVETEPSVHQVETERAPGLEQRDVLVELLLGLDLGAVHPVEHQTGAEGRQIRRGQGGSWTQLDANSYHDFAHPRTRAR